jgi:hypothetical protein
MGKTTNASVKISTQMVGLKRACNAVNGNVHSVAPGTSFAEAEVDMTLMFPV